MEIELLPCTCGCKPKGCLVIVPGKHFTCRFYFYCPNHNCGKESKIASNIPEAKREWNSMIEKEV